MNKKKPSLRENLTFKLLLCVFTLLLIILALIVCLIVLLLKFGQLSIKSSQMHPSFILIIVFAISLIITMTVSYFISIHFLNPIRKISKAMQKISHGDFDVSLEDSETEGEISNLINNFNLMAHDLKNIEILKKDFIDNVSHEFKTPISAISGYATLLSDESITEEERKKYTKNLITSVTLLNNLLENILRISQLENDASALQKNRYSLNEQIRQSVLSLEKAWSDKNLDLDIELEPLSVYGYEELNKHVWINLISNAIKFSNYGGKIDISLKKHDTYAVFSIKDNGIGIMNKDLNKIFDKFYQADSSHSKQGNGLGLALVKKICTLNGYTVSVSSTYGQGSTFKVEIPLS